MSSPTEDSSPIVRFFDSFLQEKNIKWLLGIGAVLVLGSSLCMIGPHWNDYPPVWKYLVILSYTSAIFIASEISYWRLALRKTGSGLMALTVLLLPISFIALHWVEPTQSVSLDYFAMHLPIAVLLVGNLVLSYLAASRTFRHFLRGSQPTFLASYLILCGAGAILPAFPGSWTPWIGLTLWAVFTAGVVKVNRHVFWLTEEQRLPRIFGFFPIGLLAAQFVALSSIHLARFVPECLPLEWLGLALVLVAVPVLLTADAVARVSAQRSGGLQSLSWNVAMPLGLGLLLVVAGVCLASVNMPRPFALPPTAALAACMLAIVARRTDSNPLVWLMLLMITVAYNFSPVFFRELAIMAIQQGASSLGEARLPFAFYGLTYLPLLLAMTGASFLAFKRGSQLFAQPLRVFAQSLAVVLLLAACGHPKAMFPVGCVMIGAFAMQSFCFRASWLLHAGVVSLLVAGLGWTMFAREVLLLEVTFETPFLAMAVVGLLLMAPGYWIDRASAAFCTPLTLRSDEVGAQPAWRVCQMVSAIVTVLATYLLLVGECSGQFMNHSFAALSPFPFAAAIALCGLLLIQALLFVRPAIGAVALACPLLLALVWAGERGAGLPGLTSGACAALLAWWLLSYSQAVRPQVRVVQAFALPAYRLSIAGLSALAGVYYAPQLVHAHFTGTADLPWVALALITVWCFDAGRRIARAEFTVVGCLAALGLSSAMVAAMLGVERGLSWYPVAWANVAGLAMLATALARRTPVQPNTADNVGPIAVDLTQAAPHFVHTVYSVSQHVLWVVAVCSLVAIGTPARIAGSVAIFALAIRTFIRDRRSPNRDLLILLNWQVFPLLMQIWQPNGHWIWQTTLPELINYALPVALCASLSHLLTLHRIYDRGDEESSTVSLHRTSLLLVAVLALGVGQLRPADQFGGMSIAMVLISFAAIASVQLLQAVRDRMEERAWYAIAIAALAVVYLAKPGLIHFQQGWGMYCLLWTGVTLWTLGRLAERNVRTAVLARPFDWTGLALPLGSVGTGVFRHVLGLPSHWLGANSLCLLLTAGFYFWRGLETGQKALVVGAAGIMNIALALLWRELSWSDPQWFMMPIGATILLLVEFLKRDIPTPHHNSLRYFGALVVLVSPTFHIVQGSWAHLLSLMVASVAIVMMSIGLRVRALMYMGTGFLLADLTAMVIRQSVERPNVLWVVGIALGAAVIGVAAAAENHREVLLQRVRLLAANMSSWE